jgi:rod shape-determining protein MreC
LLAVCAALLLGIFAAAVSDSGTNPVSAVIGYIAAPLEKAAVGVAELTRDFASRFRSAEYYKQQAEQLREEVASYREELVDYENLKYKLDAYEQFLQVRQNHPDFRYLPASVILRDANDVYGTFTINVGANDGVELNDPVIYGKTLVGVIRAASETTSTVYTLLNPEVSLGAYEIRTREDCYVEAENALSLKGQLKLSGLSKTTPIIPGGVVCSSGTGGIFPRDFLIGTVTEVITDNTSVAAYAVIEPDIDPATLTDVFVITDFTGKEE